jgi:hypothetical protein
MSLRLLLDEHLRGPLWNAVCRHNAKGVYAIEVVRVGDLPELALQSDDPRLLVWAEQNERILVSEDKHTLAGHLTDHLRAGRHSPGIFLLRPGFSVSAVLAFLVAAAHASEAWEWRDRIHFVP